MKKFMEKRFQSPNLEHFKANSFTHTLNDRLDSFFLGFIRNDFSINRIEKVNNGNHKSTLLLIICLLKWAFLGR